MLLLALGTRFWHSKLRALTHCEDVLVGRTEGVCDPLKIFVLGKQGFTTCFPFHWYLWQLRNLILHKSLGSVPKLSSLFFLFTWTFSEKSINLALSSERSVLSATTGVRSVFRRLLKTQRQPPVWNLRLMCSPPDLGPWWLSEDPYAWR